MAARGARGAGGDASAGEQGLAPILETVAEEARREADALLAEARRRAAERLEEADRTARRLEDEADAAGRAEGEREARRRIALAEIEARKGFLRLRELHIERALERAVARLAGRLEAESGSPLLADWIRAASRALGESKLRVRLAARAGRRVQAALEGSGLSLELEEVASEPGAVVTSLDGRREVDVTLRGFVARRREQARHAAAAALFGDGRAEDGGT